MTDGRTGVTQINFLNCDDATKSSGSWELSAAIPISDIMSAKQKIRSYGYNPEGAVLFMNSTTHKTLLNYLISTKGSSIPNFSSQKVETGVVQELLGLRVVVSENVTSDFACVMAEGAVRWKQFVPLTARTVEDVGLGIKIRVWEEGEPLLENPRAICLISGCGTV
jgi:hypothetical protein